MCEILEVSRSGFYDWHGRDPSDREKRRIELDKLIVKEFWASRGTYGSPRVFATLKSQGIDISETTVERRMRELGLRAISKRKFRVKTTDSNHDFGISPNLLQQCFNGYKPGEVLLGDITYIETDEGWLYLATVMDLGAREIAGWSMSENIDRHLVIGAVEMASKAESFQSGSIFHSDRGVQYACHDFRSKLDELGLLASMSAKGCCYDNAPMESFFHSLKTEMVHHQKFTTRQEAMIKIFEWIEVFYNRERIHSSLGYKTPVDYRNEVMQYVA
jgi:transposase InsO family protein